MIESQYLNVYLKLKIMNLWFSHKIESIKFRNTYEKFETNLT